MSIIFLGGRWRVQPFSQNLPNWTLNQRRHCLRSPNSHALDRCWRGCSVVGGRWGVVDWSGDGSGRPVYRGGGWSVIGGTFVFFVARVRAVVAVVVFAFIAATGGGTVRADGTILCYDAAGALQDDTVIVVGFGVHEGQKGEDENNLKIL